jgi:hypothetical protein
VRAESQPKDTTVPSHLFGAGDPKAKAAREARQQAIKAERDKAKADASR